MVENQLIWFIQEKMNGAFPNTTQMIQILYRWIAQHLEINNTWSCVNLEFVFMVYLNEHSLSTQRRTLMQHSLMTTKIKSLTSNNLLYKWGIQMILICLKLWTQSSALYLGICQWLQVLKRKVSNLCSSDQQDTAKNMHYYAFDYGWWT